MSEATPQDEVRTAGHDMDGIDLQRTHAADRFQDSFLCRRFFGATV
jgi:hypothetical protein